MYHLILWLISQHKEQYNIFVVEIVTENFVCQNLMACKRTLSIFDNNNNNDNDQTKLQMFRIVEFVF